MRAGRGIGVKLTGATNKEAKEISVGLNSLKSGRIDEKGGGGFD